MNWRNWDYVFVGGAEDDDEFREELTSLANKGLLVIGAICILAPLFVLVVGLLGVSQFLDPGAVRPMLRVMALGVVTTALARWRPAQPWSRLVGLGVGYLVGVSEIWSSLTGPEVAQPLMGSVHRIPGDVSMVMLVALAALPMRPLQTSLLGFALLVTYGLLIPLSGQTADMSYHATNLVAMVLVILISTGLTAVIYQRRLAAFAARRQAVEAFEQLREAQSKLLISETAASQGRLAAALSHELNSPLGAFTSALDTLAIVFGRQSQQRPQESEIVSGAFEAARTASGRLIETIERMKHLTNLGRAAVQLVDLNRLWQDTVALIRAEFGEDLDLNLDLAPIPGFKGNPQQLSTVFANLLRNAADAIDASGNILVTSNVRDGEVILEVRDTGKGIPADRLPHLFNPSFHVSSNRVGTTNWGLFVSQSIVANHGGRIEIESQEGEGTTARIYIPQQGG